MEASTNKDGFLKVGDVVLLVMTCKFPTFTYRSFLSADGIISRAVDCIPRYSATDLGADVITRSCLFRLEKALKYKSEETANSSASQPLMGSALTYGEWIQLKHIHSEGYVSIDPRQIALEAGCLQVYIDPKGNEMSWFELLPVNKLRKEGEIIRYTDDIFFRSVSLTSVYYLHANSIIRSENERVEVNACAATTAWKPRKYMNANEYDALTNYVTTGDSFRIFHKLTGGYLTAEQPSVYDRSNATVFLEKGNKTCNTLWELQRKCTFVGGTAQWTEVFRLKHLASGQYLKTDGEDLSVTTQARENGTFFKLEPDDETSELKIRFGIILNIFSENGLYLSIVDQSLKTRLSKKLKKRLGKDKPLLNPNRTELKLVERKDNLSNLAFIIEDVQEVQSAHVYVLALMLPSLCELYYYFSTGGESIGLDSIDHMEPEHSTILRLSCNQLSTILTNISKHVIQNHSHEVDLMKIQSSMSEMGVIDALLELARVIDDKLKRSSLSEEEQMLQVFSPAHYLRAIVKDIYRLVYESIKDNDKICRSLQPQISFMRSQLHTNIVEIGNILKEVYKYLAETVDGIEEIVTEYIRPINEREDNLQEQITYLQILTALCESDGVAVRKYQRIVLQKLFGDARFRVLTFHFPSHVPFIEFEFRRIMKDNAVAKAEENVVFETHEFLSANESLKALKDEGGRIRNADALIFNLEDVCTKTDHTKYVTAAIELFTNLCLDRHREAVRLVTKDLFASAEHLESAIANVNLPDCVRAAYAGLYRVLYVDLEQFTNVTEIFTRTYKWDPIQRATEKVEVIRPRDEYQQIKELVRAFWSPQGLISNTNSELERHSKLGHVLSLVTQFLKLTTTMVNQEMLDEEFIHILLEPLCIIVGSEGLMAHWASKLMTSVNSSIEIKYSPSLESKRSTTIHEALNILKVIVERRVNLHVERILVLFKEYAVSDGLPDMSDTLFKFKLYQILSDLSWDIKASQSYSTYFKNTSEGKPPTDIPDEDEAAEEQETSSLNIHLLKLVFNASQSRSRSIKKQALDLVISDMNLVKHLCKQLKQVELLIEEDSLNVYNRILKIKEQLRDCVQVLCYDDEDPNEQDRVRAYVQNATLKMIEIQELLMSRAENEQRMRKYQNLMRHSQVHDLMLRLLDIKFNPSLHIALFKETISALYLFAEGNHYNQRTFFAKTPLLLKLIGSQVGVTRLLTQALTRNKHDELGLLVIRHILSLIEQDREQEGGPKYRFQMLELLRTFVWNAEGEIIPSVQVDIIKLLLSNSLIRVLYMQDTGSIDYLRPRQDNKLEVRKFHIEVIKILTACSYNNRFGIFQCRKLISIKGLRRVLKSPNTNYPYKTIYLRFLFQVFIRNNPGIKAPASINDLVDIFSEVILPDLKSFAENIEPLIPLALSNMYEGVVCHQTKRTYWSVMKDMYKVASREDSVLTHKSKAMIRLGRAITPEERGTLSYWTYLSGGKKWHTQRDGLLHLLRDIFTENAVALSPDMETQVEAIKEVLLEMYDKLDELETQHSDLDFSSMIMFVNSCREALPTVIRADRSSQKPGGSEEVENKLIKLMREWIIEKKMSLEEAFSYFDMNRDGSISFVEFTSKLKRILNLQMTNKEIREALANFDTDGDQMIQFKEFTRKLRRYFATHSHVVKRRRDESASQSVQSKSMPTPISMNETEEDRTSRVFAEFVTMISEICKDRDITSLADKVNDQFVKPALLKQDFKHLIEFVSKLGTAFSKRAHKFYLVQILRNLIPKKKMLRLNWVFDDSNEAEKLEMQQIMRIQEILCEAGVLELALNLASVETDLELISEAVQLLLDLLQFGNFTVQSHLLRLLKENPSSSFFSFIRSQLRLSRERIVERANQAYDKKPEVAIIDLLSKEKLQELDITDFCIAPNSDLETLLATNIVKVLQSCSENCYTAFQNYIRSQSDPKAKKKKFSIGMVTELAQYLINLKEIGPQLFNDHEACMVIPQCLETLIDLCRGPCVENQLLLGTQRKLYKFINGFLRLRVREASEGSDTKYYDIDYFISSVRFLRAVTEGQINKGIATMMIEEIDFGLLTESAVEIYRCYIHPWLNAVMQERIEGENESNKLLESFAWMRNRIRRKVERKIPVKEWQIIDIGFEIVLLILHLREMFPNVEALNRISMHSSQKSNSEKIHSIMNSIDELRGREESFLRGVWSLLKKWRGRCKAATSVSPAEIQPEVAYSFYLSLIANLEIDRDGNLEFRYIRIPGVMAYVSSRIRNSVKTDVNLNSQEEKVKSFFHMTEKYQAQSTHLQMLSRFPTLSWWACKAESLGKVSLAIILLINIILLLSIDQRGTNSQYTINGTDMYGLLVFCGVLLSVISIFTFMLVIIEEYPSIIYDYFNSAEDDDIFSSKLATKLRGSVILKEIIETEKLKRNNEPKSNLIILWILLRHPESRINLFYIVLVILGWFNPYWYSFLLLDLIRRSDDLKNILLAVTLNKRQLILTTILGIIVLYQFSMLSFLLLGEYFQTQEAGADMNSYCSTLLECTVSTILLGVRAGGGIGESLLQPLKHDEDYDARMAIDMLFFIIVNIILLNIIFGIIIDTFAELRDKRKEIEDKFNNNCFICGRERYEFEARGNGWGEHITAEHNMWAYFAYVIHIRRKPMQECDGLEKYVKRKIMIKDVSFFPKTSRCLQEYEEQTQDELELDKLQLFSSEVALSVKQLAAKFEEKARVVELMQVDEES
jgi:hypothetical protein